MVLRPLDWPHGPGSAVVEGWEFDEDHDPASLSLDGIEVPHEVREGTPRWREWVLGRLAVRKAAHRAGIGPGLVDVCGSGAPRLRDCDWSVSIAHTRGLVVGAVAPMPIGIDAERRDRDVSRVIRSLAVAERDVAVSLGPIPTVVAKEAAAKATQLGLGGSLSRWPLVDVELCGDNPTVSIACPDERIVDVQIYHWGDFVIGIALIPN